MYRSGHDTSRLDVGYVRHMFTEFKAQLLIKIKPTAGSSARQTELLFGVLDLVQKLISKQLGGFCDDPAQAIAHYIRLLATEKSWPPSSVLKNTFSINAMLDEVKWEGPRWSFEGQDCVHCAHGNEYKFEGDLRRLKERFEGLRKGICLDCVRTDCNSLGEGKYQYCSREIL